MNAALIWKKYAIIAALAVIGPSNAVTEKSREKGADQEGASEKRQGAPADTRLHIPRIDRSLLALPQDVADSDQPKPDSPLPTSLKVLKDHTLVRLAPTNKIRRRGVVMKGTLLPALESAKGPGCAGLWYRVLTDGWICENQVRPTEQPPGGMAYPITEEGELTPWSYGFVRESSFEYTLMDGLLEQTREIHKGFGFGVEKTVQVQGQPYFLTAEGNLIPKTVAGITSRISTYKGVEITEGTGMPIGWVNSRKAWVYSEPLNKKEVRAKKAARYTVFHVLETSGMGRETFYRYDDDAWLRAPDVRVWSRARPPEGLLPGEKWIDVDTRRQIVTAYKGETPVYATLVSTGRAEGSKTVAGQYRVWVKVAAIPMDNTDEELEEPEPDAGVAQDAGPAEERHLYSLHDVPWTQFYFENFAIHGVYWHNRFGNRRSHGCVNMSPTDARWLYYWTDPQVPDGWWAIQSSPDDPGTMISVR